MGFIRKAPSIDLGDTAIENIFIDVYMPMANGTHVKVYLLAYKYALDPEKCTAVNNTTIAKNLNIPLEDVLSAWDFWESKEIIKKHHIDDENDPNYTVEFINLKQLYIDKNYKPQQATRVQEQSQDQGLSTKDLVEANQVPLIKEMFLDINKIINRPLVPNEKRIILEWFHSYNIDTALIVKAFSYCKHKKNIKSVNYVGGVIRNWYDQGITSLDQLQEYLTRQGERFALYDRVYKALGFHFREPAESDMKFMDQWADTYQFSIDVILKACESASKTSNPNISYIHRILTDWYQKGIKTVEDIAVLDKKPVKAAPENTSVKPNRFKTKFHLSESRFDQYTAEELESIILKKQRNKNKG
ncbi:DnaD domain protein [Alkaliphilus crotonatoxidans]